MTAAEKFVVWSLISKCFLLCVDLFQMENHWDKIVPELFCSVPPQSCDQSSVKHVGRFLSAERHLEVTVAVLVWSYQSTRKTAVVQLVFRWEHSGSPAVEDDPGDCGLFGLQQPEHPSGALPISTSRWIKASAFLLPRGLTAIKKPPIIICLIPTLLQRTCRINRCVNVENSLGIRQ